MDKAEPPFTYSDSGVDIRWGENFSDFIRTFPSPAVSPGLGGFAGGFEIDTDRYKHPVVLTTTDGVGTKILVAKTLNRFDTLGIDLVAMCVNDLAVCGAFPEVFLDYIACGTLDETVLKEVMKGIIRGCETAECTLSGGETAEMPDLYKPEDFDLAGFAIGIGEKHALLPKKDALSPGDIIFGLPSSGIHSNGLSLARKVIPMEEPGLFGQLLVPTRIYVRELKVLFTSQAVLAAAHITGGGLEGNLARVLPDHVIPKFTYAWPVPEIFREIQRRGPVLEEEMRRVFNMGIGIALVVHRDRRKEIEETANEHGIELLTIGELVHG